MAGKDQTMTNGGIDYGDRGDRVQGSGWAKIEMACVAKRVIMINYPKIKILLRVAKIPWNYEFLWNNFGLNDSIEIFKLD